MRSSKPLAGYLRLSQDRHGDKDGYRVQREGIQAWAASTGNVIGDWYIDPDITAADEDVVRPEYERMLTDLQAGMWGGIAVWQIDRLTRLKYEYERSLRFARRANAYIVSTGDGLRSDTETGEMGQSMKVMFAQNEVAQTKRRVTANKGVRAADGKYSGGGKRPYGFAGAEKVGKKVMNTGLVGVQHVPHEVQNLQEAARRIAWEGWSYTDVVYDWHSRDIFGVTGAPWNPKTLQTILTGPRMVAKQIHRVADPETGEVAETLVDAVWERVLDDDTWNRLRSLVRASSGRGAKMTYLLSPVARCGVCDRPLTGATRKYKRQGEIVSTRTYRCKSMPADKARGACGKLGVLADPVENLVVARILHRVARTRGATAAISEEADVHTQIEKLSADLEYLAGELTELANAQKNPAARMGMREFMTLRQPIVDQIQEAESRLASLTQRLSVPAPVGKDFDDLPGWYEALRPAQQMKLVAANVEKVVVLAPGRSGRYFNPERVKVSLAGSQDADVKGE